MNKPTTLSPLKAIEEILYQRVKETPFRVWHYFVALAFLTIIPTLLSGFLQSNVGMAALYIIVAIAWGASRVIGRNLSRNKGVDSVLIYRFFAAVPWLIALVSTGIPLLVMPLDSLSRLLYTAMFWIAVVVSIMHILGIVIHLHKNKQMIRNIKKDELFQ